MIKCYALDGDNIRHDLKRDRGFSTLPSTFVPDVLLETDVKTLDECLSILLNDLTGKGYYMENLNCG